MTTKFRRFREYLSSTGKLDSPKVDASADTGPSGDNTPKSPATKGKGWEAGVKSTGKPVPYSNATKPVGKDFSEHPKGEKDGEPFTKKGDNKLVYEPKTPKDFSKEGGTKVASWPKTTKEFLDTTKEMTISELSEFIGGRYQSGLTSGGIGNLASLIPGADPIIATQYVSALASANDSVMETLVREIKRLGCLDKLVAEIFKQPETYPEVAHAVSENASVTRRLERALKETRVQEVVDAPATDTEDGGSNPPIAANTKLVPSKGSKARRNPKSIGDDNNKLDMSSSDVVTTKASIRRAK